MSWLYQPLLGGAAATGTAATYVFNPLTGRGAGAAQPIAAELMPYLGDYDTSTIVYGKFATYRPSSGAAFTLGGTPALSVYKDNGTTQSTSGVTLTADFDSVTGLNHFAIDTSADGTFYAAGSNFDVVITTGTVDSISVVGSVVASFSLRKNSGLKPTTAGRTLDVSAGGEAGIDWANVGSPTTTLGLTGTTVGTVTLTTTATNLTNERGKYANGAVWIGPAANTNTASYVDGIITNPVSTLAAAKTIADNLGLRRFYTVRTGTTQIAADCVGYDFDGNAWSLTTNGTRDVSSSSFHDAKVISGSFVSTSAESHWERCEFSDGVSVGAIHATRCTFTGTLTMNPQGTFDFIDCASVVAGTSAPVFDCASPNATYNISFRRWSGGITINNINTNCTISIDVVSGGTVTLNGANGNVQVRGNVSSIVDNRTGSPTLGQNAAINITKIADSIWDEARADHTTAGTFGEGAASVQGNVTGNVGGNVTGTVGSLATQAKADVNAEVVDVLNTDTFAEPAQGAPGATVSLAEKLGFLYKAWRNRATQTASQYSLYNDDASTVDHKATFSDNGTTADRGEIASGP